MMTAATGLVAFLQLFSHDSGESRLRGDVRINQDLFVLLYTSCFFLGVEILILV